MGVLPPVVNRPGRAIVEGHLRGAIKEYLVHYNTERNHQEIGNERIDRRAATGSGPIECAERLGGLLKFYQRAA